MLLMPMHQDFSLIYPSIFVFDCIVANAIGLPEAWRHTMASGGLILATRGVLQSAVPLCAGQNHLAASRHCRKKPTPRATPCPVFGVLVLPLSARREAEPLAAEIGRRPRWGLLHRLLPQPQQAGDFLARVLGLRIWLWVKTNGIPFWDR